MGSLDLVTGGVLVKTIAYASTTAGDQATPVVSVPAGKKVRIFAISAVSNIGGTNFYLRNGAGGTVLTETFYRSITGAQTVSYYSRVGYQGIWLYETEVGKSIVLNCTTAGAQVSISLTYTFV